MMKNLRIDYISQEDVSPEHPARVFSRAWRECLDKEGIPRWSRFDPMSVPRTLAWCMILKPGGDGELVFAIFGDACQDLVQRPMQGRKFLDEMPHQALRERMCEFRLVSKTGKALFSETAVPFPNRNFIQLHRGTFPFFQDDEMPGVNVAKLGVVIAPVCGDC